MLAEYAPGPSASHRPRIARHADPSATRLRSEEELKGGLDHALKEHSAGDAGRRLVGPFLLSIAPRAMALASRCGRAHARLEMAPRRRGRAFNAGPRAISTRRTLAIGKGWNPRRQSTNFRDGHSASNVVADLYMGQSAPLPRLIHLTAPPSAKTAVADAAYGPLRRLIPASKASFQLRNVARALDFRRLVISRERRSCCVRFGWRVVFGHSCYQ